MKAPSSILARDEAAIDANSGKSSKCRLATAQAELARGCAENSEIVRREDYAIAAIRGQCENTHFAIAQDELEQDCGQNSAIRRIAADESADKSGVSSTEYVAQDHAKPEMCRCS